MNSTPKTTSPKTEPNSGTAPATAPPHPDPRSTDPPGTAAPQRGWYSRGYLPHFDSPHALQHITYRLSDSLPRSALAQMQAELNRTLPDETARNTELRRRIEAYLDAGHGSCILQRPDVAACVIDTWLHFDGVRYRLLEWVVMPNHCHVLIEPLEGEPLDRIVLSWKSFTARWINGYSRRAGARRSQGGLRLDSQPGSGSWPDGPPVKAAAASGPRQKSRVWQREYWDRFIRDERHLAAVRHYIIMNPVSAGLVMKPEDWRWSSARARAKGEG